MEIFFVSLGCDKNLVDSEIMLGILSEDGHRITYEEEKAEAVIINTCGFLADATDEGVQTILRMGAYKKDGNLKALIVAGCMVQRYKEKILEELPEVDAVVGTNDFEAIGSVLKRVSEGEKVQLISERSISEKSHLKRLIATPQHFAYLKIAEGCDNCCTYCTIPSIRGAFRSRTMDSLIEEAKFLADKGVKELILVAQDTSLYGKDLYGKPQLHILLQKLSDIEDLRWLRIMYCYPEHITDEIIEEMARNKKVCHYIDMPIQHASDSVLKRMGRRSSNEKIRNIVAKMREAMPDIAIRTTVIVGFPAETEQEFDELMKTLKDIKFDRLGAFAYSKEDGTPAYKMKNQIKKSLKNGRKDNVMSLQMDISKRKCKSLVGQTVEVLVDGKIPEDNVYCGRSFRDSYDVDGMVFFSSKRELVTGDFVRVLIKKSSEYDVTGVEVE